MTALEILAILLLVGALMVLLYYYLSNNPQMMNKARSYVPTGVSNPLYGNESNNGSGESTSINMGEENMSEMGNDEKTSVSDKLKDKFKDIDMPNINTDVFSKKIDAFLDEKSDQLIKDWELATKEDTDELAKRCDVAYSNIDSLEKRFNEYKSFTNERIDSIDERLAKLEKE
ncbi:MAG: hypothetical protein ACRC1M_04595 [Methanobacteriaceae archaeon]